MSVRENEGEWCCRCQSDFPIAEGNVGWRMGFMRPLAKAPKKIRDQFRSWKDHPEGGFLCGSCYFDLTDA